MTTLTGGQLPSRFGIRGSEKISSSVNAIFNLESGFFLDNGASGQNGRLFGRSATVGVDEGWGTLTFGRQYTMSFWAQVDADIIGPSALSMASFDSYIPNARSDNSIAYRNRFGPFTVGATYSLGRDTSVAANCAGESSSNSVQCRGWSGLLKYDQAQWGIAMAIDEKRGGRGANPVPIVLGSASFPMGTSSNCQRHFNFPHWGVRTKSWTDYAVIPRRCLCSMGSFRRARV